MAVDFRAKQAEFAAYIRDPVNHPAPADVDPQRMAMYRELFFNNIDSFLATSFPVLRSLFDERHWQELAADFFACHRCHTPYFSEIAEEFLDYLQQRWQPDDYPFLWELAHYEWVELALAIAQDEPLFASDAQLANLEQLSLVLSPLAWLLAYQYPVQQISPDFIPAQPPAQATYLVVYRDAEYEVHFMQAAPVTFRLLQLLEQQAQTVAEAVGQLAAEIPGSDINSLLPHALSSLREMAAKGIIVIAAS